MHPRTSVCICALAGAVIAFGGCQNSSTQAAANLPPPPTVLFTKAVRRDLPLYVEAVASLDGYVNADIRARVRGYLKTQDYKDGSFVKENQRLFTIEDTEYRAALASAQAALARARSQQQRNRLEYERDVALFQSGAVSKQEIDNAEASIGDANGQVAAAQAQIEQAQLSLSYTQIHSPTEGVAGLASVRIGNLVGQDGPTLLTIVSQIDPIRVTFPLSEVDYVKYPSRFIELSKRDLAWAKRQFKQLESGALAEHDDPGVELELSDGTVYPQRGIIVTVNRQIDATTGTIQLQALFPNPNNFLRPGQYGRVRLRREHEGYNTIAVPDKALISVQGSYSVAVIGDDSKVHMRKVEAGPSVAGLRIIQKGVTEGDKVVVEGVQKVSDGAQVQAKPAPEATAEIDTQRSSAAN